MNNLFFHSNLFQKYSYQLYWMTTWNSIKPGTTAIEFWKITQNKELARLSALVHRDLSNWGEMANDSLSNLSHVMSPLDLGRKSNLISNVKKFIEEIKKYDLKLFSSELQAFIRVVINFIKSYQAAKEDDFIKVENYADLLFQSKEYVTKTISGILQSKIDSSFKEKESVLRRDVPLFVNNSVYSFRQWAKNISILSNPSSFVNLNKSFTKFIFDNLNISQGSRDMAFVTKIEFRKLVSELFAKKEIDKNLDDFFESIGWESSVYSAFGVFEKYYIVDRKHSEYVIALNQLTNFGKFKISINWI